MWLLVFCIALGLLYAYLLYNNKVSNEGLPRWLKIAMFSTRAVVVSALAFLLLSPLIKSINRTVEKPVVVIAQDNSSSLLMAGDTSYLKSQYLQELKKLSSALAEKYEVKTYSFAEKINENPTFIFDEKQTDIEQLFNELENRYVNRNLGAVILASDGVYNAGENPLYISQNLKCPIYTVALGDTTIHQDLILQKVNHNKTVYSGNSFPIEIVMQAKMFKGKEANLLIERDGKVIHEQKIAISSDNYSKSIPLQLKSEASGTMHYIVKLQPLNNEVTLLNNTLHVFIDVITNKQKILLLADAPHPDIAAIRQSIEKNENYEVDFALASDFNQSIEKYNLVILHQLPSQSGVGNKVLSELEQSPVSRWFITGANSNFNVLNTVQKAINLSSVRPKFNEVVPSINATFSLFTFSTEAKKIVTNFPPLKSPFASTKVSTGAAVLLNQKIGAVTTNDPLLLFSEINSVKTGVLLGEGLWRWKISNYQQTQNHDAFDELVIKAVQYLSIKTDKRLFKVNYKNNYKEGESISFDAQLFNESYEPINEPDVKLKVTSENGKSFSYQFSKLNDAYYLSIPSLPVGNYSFDAEVTVGAKVLKEKGSFSVKQINVEALNTSANHQLLNAIAQKTGAKMVYAKQLESLKALLFAKEEITPISYSEEKLQDLLNLKWIFYVLMGFLAFEWFVRKRFGGY